jgi:hypothetical protein
MNKQQQQPPSNASLDIQTHHLRANSRFEIAGVVLGVIPLMTVAFRSFHDVQALVVEYDHFDQNLQSTLRDIYSAKCLLCVP